MIRTVRRVAWLFPLDLRYLRDAFDELARWLDGEESQPFDEFHDLYTDHGGES